MWKDNYGQHNYLQVKQHKCQNDFENTVYTKCSIVYKYAVKNVNTTVILHPILKFKYSLCPSSDLLHLSKNEGKQ